MYEMRWHCTIKAQSVNSRNTQLFKKMERFYWETIQYFNQFLHSQR